MATEASRATDIGRTTGGTIADTASSPLPLAGGPLAGLPFLLPEFAEIMSGRCGKASRAVALLVSSPSLYLEHYSKAVIFSEAAERGVVLPDKKPLPSLVS